MSEGLPESLQLKQITRAHGSHVLKNSLLFPLKFYEYDMVTLLTHSSLNKQNISFKGLF